MYDDAIASYAKETRTRARRCRISRTALADAYEAKGMTQQAQDARSKAAQFKGQDTD